MISMSRINDIRRLGREGKNVSEIARAVGVCRDTVYKYLKADDLSPKIPVRKGRKSKLDPYRPPVESWLDEDRECWRKQRHTASRIWRRLADEEHVIRGIVSPAASDVLHIVMVCDCMARFALTPTRFPAWGVASKPMVTDSLPPSSLGTSLREEEISLPRSSKIGCPVPESTSVAVTR